MENEKYTNRESAGEVPPKQPEEVVVGDEEKVNTISVDSIQQANNVPQEYSKSSQEIATDELIKQIADAQSFDELRKILIESERYGNDPRNIPTDVIIDTITQIENGVLDGEKMTKAFGLEAKVLELLRNREIVDNSSYGWGQKGSSLDSKAEDLSKYNVADFHKPQSAEPKKGFLAKFFSK